MRLRIATVLSLLTLTVATAACDTESDPRTMSDADLVEELQFRGLVECGINCNQHATENYLKGGEEFAEDSVIQQFVINEVHAEIGAMGCAELELEYVQPRYVDPDGWTIGDVLRENPFNEAEWTCEVSPPEEMNIYCH